MSERMMNRNADAMAESRDASGLGAFTLELSELIARLFAFRHALIPPLR
jgi:hypothetical protein